MSDDGKSPSDEKSSASAKLESMTKEELLKIVKNYTILKKRLDTKISELSTSNVTFCQTEEELRNQLDDEQTKSKKLIIELNQYKNNESKLQQELNKERETLECFQLQNDSLKSSSKNLQEEILNLQNELSNVRSSLSNIEEDLTTQLNESKNLRDEKQLFEQEKGYLSQCIQNLETINEELTTELDDLRTKSNLFDKDKQVMEEEIVNYRKQIEEVEFNKSQQQSSVVSVSQLDETVSESMNSLLNHIDQQEESVSKVLSDIPTLLQSVGIPDEDFSSPLNLESILRLCSLLSERCKVLQNNNNNKSTDNELVSIIQNDDNQCRVLINRRDHSEFDTLFERLYTWMDQSIPSNDWQILLSKPVDQSLNQYIRLEFNDIKFVSVQIEHGLIELRHQLDQLSKAKEDQQHEITTLKENLHSSEQFTEQCQQVDELQNILDKKTAEFDQKLLHIDQLQSSYDLLKEDFNTNQVQLENEQEIHNKLKVDYEHQHLYLLERDENIRLLKLELDQHKQLVDNTNHNQDERYSALLKQHQQLSDLLETKIDEAKKLTEKNAQLENDLTDNNDLLFEKTKQGDDLDRQLQVITNEYEDLKMKFDQAQEEEKKLNNEINLLMNKIQNREIKKSESIQIIDNFKQELENNKLNFDQTIEKNNEEKSQMENQLQQTIENLKQELELHKNDLKDLQLKYTEEKQSIIEDSQQPTPAINSLQAELEKFQQENEKLQETINELNHKLESQTTQSDEIVRDLKEKLQKMKMLLTRLKKELQEKNQHPKQSLIDLELADYEKTIKTLKEDLTTKDKEIQKLRDELTTITDKNTSFKQEIQNLETQILQTEERANILNTLLDTAKIDLQNAKDREEQRHHNDDNVRVLIDKLQTELDDNKVSMSQLLSDKQQLTDRLNNQNEATQRMINLLEQNLSIATHDLNVIKQDYDTLQDDFNNYKIRAQSVLKQHQSTQRECTPSVADNHTEFEETIEKLKTTLREANHKIQLLISENETLQKEQDRLAETQTKLINETRKREQDLRKQHQIELDKIENESLRRTNDNNDMMKNVTLQNETLSTTFKEQIASIEGDRERSISILQNQLQVAKQEIEQLKNRIDLLRQTSIDNERDSTQITINNDFSKDDLPWAYAERQQGEGSESVSTDYQATDVAVKTLENVLFGNGTNSRISTANVEKPRHVLFEDIELERQRFEEELTKTKFRLLNTTELLNESELNNVRLSEQVTLLKDEIRRLERNMDRAESISNLEYLKNIIVKFFILKSTPERLQLIPVLVTMLKLSPDEQAKLVSVAQQTASIEDYSSTSELNTQQGTNTANPNSSSWSSYLNMW